MLIAKFSLLHSFFYVGFLQLIYHFQQLLTMDQIIIS